MDIKETIVLKFDACKNNYEELRENRDSYSSMINIEDIKKNIPILPANEKNISDEKSVDFVNNFSDVSIVLIIF